MHEGIVITQQNLLRASPLQKFRFSIAGMVDSKEQAPAQGESWGHSRGSLTLGDQVTYLQSASEGLVPSKLKESQSETILALLILCLLRGNWFWSFSAIAQRLQLRA